jgi:CCR4-NOT transcription complex subunit 4
VLQRREFFGRYGEVLKVPISRSNASSQQSTSNPTTSVYITYVKEEEALRCIQAVNGFVLDGRQLRACFGTTKYCHAWLKSMPCNNPDCLYLHDIGTQEDSLTKEEMVSPCTSKIQQRNQNHTHSEAFIFIHLHFPKPGVPDERAPPDLAPPGIDLGTSCCFQKI